MATTEPAALDGLVVVDKPAGHTSHDVVARIRRIAGTRKVGHAGTLDPMATGVLVLGVGRATRLLGHLALTTKAYDATIRLGASTVTDDADGEVLATASTPHVGADDLDAAMAHLTGAIQQVPSSVSAVKVDGQRSYRRVRAGESVELVARPVTVTEFRTLATQRTTGFIDVDVHVECSSGTYIRALARDLGAGLGVGGHLTALRRTRVGPYDLSAAHTLDELADSFVIVAIAEAARAAFPTRDVDVDEARVLSHGGRLSATGTGDGVVAAFGPDGTFLALVEDRGDQTRAVAVFV